jgi:hypothetical protein
VPHPAAAKSAWKGGTVKGGACAIASATRPEGAPLTGLAWRATQSEADEAPVSLWTRPVGAARLSCVNALSGFTSEACWSDCYASGWCTLPLAATPARFELRQPGAGSSVRGQERHSPRVGSSIVVIYGGETPGQATGE